MVAVTVHLKSGVGKTITHSVLDAAQEIPLSFFSPAPELRAQIKTLMTLSTELYQTPDQSSPSPMTKDEVEKIQLELFDELETLFRNVHGVPTYRPAQIHPYGSGVAIGPSHPIGEWLDPDSKDVEVLD